MRIVLHGFRIALRMHEDDIATEGCSRLKTFRRVA
jgi:hypothetical protein